MKKSLYDHCIENNNTQLLDMYSVENPLPPDKIAICSQTKVKWKCKNGHIFIESPLTLKRRKNYCIECNNAETLSKVYPNLTKYWDSEKNGISPDEVSAKSIRAKKYYWICKNGHSIYHRVQSGFIDGDFCPICNNNERLLINARPDLMSEWDYEKNDVDISTVKIGNSSLQIWWKCRKCGGSYRKPVQKKALRNTCPYCTGHRFMKGLNDYATVYPKAAMDWNNELNESTPSDIPKRFAEEVFWKCHICGYEWKESPLSRKDRPCKKCNKKKNP